MDYRKPEGIDAQLLQSFMEQVSAFGCTGDGGVDRPALTDDHAAARNWFRAELENRGYRVLIDDIGNVFGHIDCAGPEAPLVMLGSHLDSQPKGGRFDGAYGVVAALAAVETLRAQAARQGETPACNYIIADWMNEEGARFQPSLMGSSVFAGLLDRDFAHGRCDRDGRRVRDELTRCGVMGEDTAPRPDCYLEVHIEGDSKMEKSGARIAPFIRFWGAAKLRIEVTGEQNHTGPTPMSERRDAVFGAALVVTRLRELAGTAKDTLHTSVGRMDISPNSPNIVPGRAELFAELRAPEPETLEWAEAELRHSLPQLAQKADVGIEIIAVEHRPAGRFDSRLVSLCETAATAFGYPTMRLDTIAGHDAVALSAIVPSIVFAVPSVNGVIHRHDEYTSSEDLTAGGDVLLDMVRRIDRAGGSLDKAVGGT